MIFKLKLKLTKIQNLISSLDAYKSKHNNAERTLLISDYRQQLNDTKSQIEGGGKVAENAVSSITDDFQTKVNASYDNQMWGLGKYLVWNRPLVTKSANEIKPVTE